MAGRQERGGHTRVSKYLKLVLLRYPMNNQASLLLDEQLCFALYSASNHIIRAYRGPLAEIGLTYSQYLAMLVLWQHGEQSVKGLSDQLLLDSSTLTPLLKRLESAGLVKRKRDPNDERVVRVMLTPQGRALRPKAALIQCQVADKTRLSNQGFVQLRAQLNELTAALAPAKAATRL